MKKFTTTLWLLVITTMGLWLLSKPSLSVITDNPIKALTQVSALLGAIGYFTSYIFSSRLPFFEKALPLDKSYKLHRIIGTLAGSGILLHVATLITNLLPSPIALKLYLLPSTTNPSYSAGILAFYLLFLMLLTTVYMKFSYHTWKLIHKITSYSIVFATIHLLLISSDISTYLPLRIFMFGLVFAGAVAWIYREFIYPKIAFSHEYIIKEVIRLDSISVITLVAQFNPLKLEPGQFAFFKIRSKDSQISSEAHPFTVLSHANATIMVAIKNLGDYTANLSTLSEGDTVRIAGPHGSFGREIIESKRPMVLIAGGIGITPFFNLISYFASVKKKNDFSLFYATSDQDKLFHPLLLGYSTSVRFAYSYHCSATSTRLSPDTVFQSLKNTPIDNNYFLCGPKGLLLSFMNALEAAGVPRSQIFTEDFDFKTEEL